ncbi:MAG: carbon-nitrogen hydrolase family protein [Thermoplasmata archaeon]|nr:carbon-nitrogen hydrolase family protein [Thermoplasmata archaeon]
MKITIAAVCLSPRLRDKEHNLRRMRDVLGEEDLAIFPELYLTGYTIRDEICHLAETMDGPSVEEVRRIAADTGTHILFGMAEKEGKVEYTEGPGGKRKFYNTSVLVSPNGEVRSYRKFFPVNFGPFEENTYFMPGERLEVADTSIGKIGMTVCYDLFFPELTKSYALLGAELVTNISASPHTTRPFFEQLLPSRAIESTVYVAYSNTVGIYGNMSFWGGGRIIDPRGKILARSELFKEDTARTTIDLSRIQGAREMRPTLEDTRPGFLRWNDPFEIEEQEP